MKIDKAIETLKEDLASQDTGEPSIYQDAIKLGIEALKEIERARTYSVGLIPNLLPGETKDIT